MTTFDRRTLIGGGLATLGAGLVPAWGQTYRSPGVYVEEVSKPVAIEALPTDHAVLVTSFLSTDVPVHVRYTGQLSDVIVPSRLAEVTGWVSAFFHEGGRSLYLFPAASPDADGLIGSADALGGLRGLARAGQLIGGSWTGAERPVPVGLILVPEASALAAEDRDGAASVMRETALAAEALGALAVLDMPPSIDGAPSGGRGAVTAALDWHARLGIDSGHAALYAVPSAAPSIAGVIARTDRERGVWKAPAGLSAAVRLPSAPDLRPSERDRLNEAGINTLLVRAGSGTFVWGARTLASLPAEDRYISVRRTADHLRHTFRWGLEPLSAEPNERATWDRARMMCESHLGLLWRAGAFPAPTPNEAYFVRCGLGQTMTAADLAAGRMALQFGFAPLKPAEFIVDTVTVEGFTPVP